MLLLTKEFGATETTDEAIIVVALHDEEEYLFGTRLSDTPDWFRDIPETAGDHEVLIYLGNLRSLEFHGQE